jgi:hypothetical protein
MELTYGGCLTAAPHKKYGVCARRPEDPPLFTPFPDRRLLRKVIHVSTHVSLREAIEKVRPDRELAVIQLAHDALRKLGVESPRMAVAGLTPTLARAASSAPRTWSRSRRPSRRLERRS